jgi:pimeloyl-ACP methyl ester carboxylesterase
MNRPAKRSFSFLKAAVIFPGSRMKTTKDALARVHKHSSILSCTTSSGDQVGLLFGRHLPSVAHPSLSTAETRHLLYFYGNGMCLETSSYEFARFRQLGFNVLIAEYPGYGMSSGQASESGCYEAADAAYHYLTEILQVHPAQILVAGWSLGAAVAIDLAARKQLAGLIALSPFTNIPEQARAMFPWLPQAVVRLFIQERFDNLSKIGQVTCPIFIAHGTQDELVPFVMAERLARAARQHSPLTFLPIQGCGHNGIFEARRGRVWTAIKDFSNTC